MGGGVDGELTCVRAEHSTYLTAFNSLANFSPCSIVIGFCLFLANFSIVPNSEERKYEISIDYNLNLTLNKTETRYPWLAKGKRTKSTSYKFSYLRHPANRFVSLREGMASSGNGE